MPSFFSSLRARRGTSLAAALAGGVWLLALLAISDIDPAPLRTLRTVADNGVAVLETRYNPFGLLLFGVLAAAACVGAVALARFALPRLGSATPVSADQVASAQETFDRELSGVLTVIRGGLAHRESYARSLAHAQGRLAELPEAAQVRVIVSLLVAENERMRVATADDTRKIEDAAREIEALQDSLRGAEEAALEDPLTGIGNRRRFNLTMQRAVADSNARQTALSLIMCDIDHFKRVNDRFGHHVGDEIIKALARVIGSSVRDTDTVARYGGEEFAIILPMTTQQEARAMAERIRRQFGAKQFAVRETSQKIGQLTASFGVAEHRLGDAVDALVQRADAKLYEAKTGGRDRVAVCD